MSLRSAQKQKVYAYSYRGIKSKYRDDLINSGTPNCIFLTVYFQVMKLEQTAAPDLQKFDLCVKKYGFHPLIFELPRLFQIVISPPPLSPKS